jgi:hypothetical protein
VISSASFTSNGHERPMRLSSVFPLYKLHRVKVLLTSSAQVENRGNIWMTNPRRRAGFAQKTKPSGLLTEIFFIDDFQRHGAVPVGRFSALLTPYVSL